MKGTKVIAVITALIFHCYAIDAQIQKPSVLQSSVDFGEVQNQRTTNTLGPFRLLSPMNDTLLYTEPGSLSSVRFRWTTSENAYRYLWSYMNLEFPGNPQISAPVIPVLAPDTALSITMGYFDHILDSLGAVLPGDSVKLVCGAFAQTAIFNPVGRWPDTLIVFWLVRSAQIQAFDLQSPANLTRVLVGGNPANPMQFNWQRAVSPAPRDVQYAIELATSPSFTNPMYVGASDSLGVSARASFSVGRFDSLLAAAGVNLGDSIQLYWKVDARLSRTSVTSTSTYSAWFVRTGLTSSTSRVSENQLSLYPNPAKELVRINGHGAVMEDVRVFHVNGAEVMQLQPNAEVADLVVHALPAGTYVVRVQSKFGVFHGRLVITR